MPELIVRGASEAHLRSINVTLDRRPTGARCAPPSIGSRRITQPTPPSPSTTGCSPTRCRAPTAGIPLESYNPASRELITAAKIEPALVGRRSPGDVVQFERLGYFARDGAGGSRSLAAFPPHRGPARRVGQHPEAPPTGPIGGRTWTSHKPRPGRRSRSLGVLITIRADGRPQSSDIVYDLDGGHVRDLGHRRPGQDREPAPRSSRRAARLRRLFVVVRVLRRHRRAVADGDRAPTTPPVMPSSGTTSGSRASRTRTGRSTAGPWSTNAGWSCASPLGRLPASSAGSMPAALQ